MTSTATELMSVLVLRYGVWPAHSCHASGVCPRRLAWLAHAGIIDGSHPMSSWTHSELYLWLIQTQQKKDLPGSWISILTLEMIAEWLITSKR